MLDMVPNAEQMTILVGKPLYKIWTQLCALIDERYDMERLWGSGGKHGPMSINTAAAAKPYAHSMREKTASDLWSS